MATPIHALEPGLTSPAPTRRASRQELTLSPGVELGTLPTRAAKALAAAGLADMGITARYMITDPHHGGAPFKVVTQDFETIERITTARAFLRGLLHALYPPDLLATEITTERSTWAALQGRTGRAIQMWSWACGAPDCCLTASVRLPDQDRAWSQLERMGWTTSATFNYLCPDCANERSIEAGAQ